MQGDRINRILRINSITHEKKSLRLHSRTIDFNRIPVNPENPVNPVYFWFLWLVSLLLLNIPSCLAQGAITALEFSPDGKRLAVGTYRKVVVINPENWQTVAVFDNVEDYARSLAFYPDGKTLVIGCGEIGRSGRLLFWEMTSSKPARKLLSRQNDSIEAIALRKDGKGMLIAANDNKASYFMDLPSERQFVMDDHNGRVQAVAFSPKESFLYVTGAMDRVVKVWDEKYRMNVVNFDQSQGGITGLAFLNSGNQFVGSSLDGRLYWWQVDYNARQSSYRGRSYRNILAHDGGVFRMAISGDGKRLLTTGADKLVTVWDAEGGGKQKEFKDSQQPNYALALSPDGKIAAAGGREGVMRIWDVDGNKLLHTLTPTQQKTTAHVPIPTTPKAEKRK